MAGKMERDRGRFLEKIRLYMEKHRLIGAGDTVCVGLSGGADSVCLLLVLAELRDTGRFPSSVRLCAVHINHCLRGKESDGDQHFVESLCARYQIPLFLYAFPVRKIAEERGLGEEETGRALRREAYADCVTRRGVTKIALAHHRNDCAETLLFHAARGSSLRGMTGIRPSVEFAGARMIRPLLCVRREEIESWLQSGGVRWRTDSTNLLEDYARNGIRRKVIPYLEKNVNTAAVDHMAHLAEDLAETEDFLAEETRRRAEKYVVGDDALVLIRGALREEPALMRKRILYQTFCRFCGSEKDVGRRQVLDLDHLLDLQTGRHLDFPYGVRAERIYEGIRLTRIREPRAASERRPDRPDEGAILLCPGTLEYGGWKFSCTLYGKDKAAEILENIRNGQEKKYTKWLDYDKIKDGLCVRTRRPGDYLKVSGGEIREKLKKYLIDSKIPREERENLVLLASGSEIWWVVGYRISEACEITKDTGRVLEISAEAV